MILSLKIVKNNKEVLKNQDLHDFFPKNTLLNEFMPGKKLIKLHIFSSVALNMQFLHKCFGGYISA